jgi:class 3 adenylate cyclase
MAERPTGTVTFLFTDIEGSTLMWEESPDAMRSALARHDEIVRSAIEGNGGYVFATGGDGFAAAFGSVGDGVAAAVAAQSGLGSEPWNEATTIRARMGLHLGEVDERDGDYFGSPVNRTARLMAIGHGGQVLCSDAVVGLTDTATTDLGEHRLRDLSSTVQVFQLDLDGHVEFPALRTAEAYRGNLPAQLTDFVGRTEEIKDVIAALDQSRVVTVVGVGGVGKTRLATQVAAELLPRRRVAGRVGPTARSGAGCRGSGIGLRLRPTLGHADHRCPHAIPRREGAADRPRQL